jgi:hypothetical protein
MSDRKYRQAFKAFMTKYVIGSGLLSSIDPRSIIRNLPEALGMFLAIQFSLRVNFAAFFSSFACFLFVNQTK